MATSKIQYPQTDKTRVALNNIVNISTGDITLSTAFDASCRWLVIQASVGDIYCIGIIPAIFVGVGRTLFVPTGKGYVRLDLTDLSAGGTVRVVENTSGYNIRYLAMVY